ncbi:MAG: FlgO family outer membrane protein [Spirochaetes bacterium]|jgi:Tfp pilus assembly protein PilF/TolB-like protein|nr:FlgO family outer membrane protein [Spirochaetota bacterium]
MKRTTLVFIFAFQLLFVGSLFAEKVIGVSSFSNLTMDKSIAWLEIGLADSISYKLKNVQDYIVIDRVNVDKVLGEVQLGQSGVLDETKAKKAGKALGADIIVVGNYVKSGNRIRINAKLVEVESHKILKQVQSDGVLDNIFELQDEIALKIINQTNIAITLDVKNRITQNFTSNISAYEFYVKGQEFLLNKLNYVQAIEMFNKAVSIDANYSLAYAGLGKAYSLRYWELRNYANKIDLSLIENSFKFSKKAIEISPNLDEAHLSVARYYQEADDKRYPNKWKLCEDETRKALEINPNNAEAYFLLSRIYGYDDAKEEEYLLKAIRLNNFLTDAHNNLGVIYLDQKKLDLAEQSFTKAIEIDPEFKTGYMNLGVVYDRKDQLERALDMYKIVLQKYPDYPLGIINLGIGYRRLNRLDEAMEQFQKAVKVKPDYANAWSEIGYVHLLRNQHAEAIKNYLVSLKYDPKYRYTLANLGYCYAQTGDNTNAVKYLRQAHDYHPDYAWPAGYLGWLYRNKLNDASTARFWYGEAAKRDPNNADYRKNLSELQ